MNNNAMPGEAMDEAGRVAEEVSAILVRAFAALDLLDRHLELLRTEPSAQQQLAQAFRAIHSARGTSDGLTVSDWELLSNVRVNTGRLLERMGAVLSDLTLLGITGQFEVSAGLGTLKRAMDSFSEAPAATPLTTARHACGTEGGHDNAATHS